MPRQSPGRPFLFLGRSGGKVRPHQAGKQCCGGCGSRGGQAEKAVSYTHLINKNGLIDAYDISVVATQREDEADQPQEEADKKDEEEDKAGGDDEKKKSAEERCV